LFDSETARKAEDPMVQLPPNPALEPLTPLTGTLIISRDDASEVYTVLHYDSRGVSRVYEMTFDDGAWKIWRNAPGFSQRFTGTLADDGRSIRASWEKSPDGSDWEHDFDLLYTRAG
jgi:hypothetical protein